MRLAFLADRARAGVFQLHLPGSGFGEALPAAEAQSRMPARPVDN